jgi:hypothetical protein
MEGHAKKFGSRRTVMSRNFIVAAVFVGLIISSSLVMEGIELHHLVRKSQAVRDNSAAKATASTNISNAQTDAAQNVSADNTVPGTANAATQEASELQTDPDAPTADAGQTAATVGTLPASPIALQPVATPRAKVVSTVLPRPTAAAALEPPVSTPPPAAPPVQAMATRSILVPRGTALMVRLAEPLGSLISAADQSFSATIDRDVVMTGKTIIPAGADVIGRVVVARPAGAVAGEANLELTITSVRFNDADLPVVTSVLAFGPTIKGKNRMSIFVKGLVKRAVGDEREVLLADGSAYSFVLKQGLVIE